MMMTMIATSAFDKLAREDEVKAYIERTEKTIQIPPEINKTLFPYQERHSKLIIAAILGGNGVAVDLSDTGTGKTYTAMATARYIGVPVYYICYKRAIDKIFQVARMFGTEVLGVCNYESIIGERHYTSERDFITGNKTKNEYIMAKKEKLDGKNVVSLTSNFPDRGVLLVFDEVHRAKNARGSTLINQILVSLLQSISPQKRRYMLLMSASISANLEEFMTTAYALGLYNHFNKRTYRNYLMTLGFTDADKLQEINKRIIPYKGARMDILTIMNGSNGAGSGNESQPPKLSSPINPFMKNFIKVKAVDMGRLTEKQIDETEKAILKQNCIGELQKLRKQSEILRVPAMVAHAIKKIEKGMSSVIFVNFLDSVALAKKLFEVGGVSQVATITGDVKTDRQETIKAFEDDKIRALVCTIQSGGVSISLHDTNGKHPRRSFISPTWSAVDLLQCFGRIYRAGQKSDSKQYVMFCKNTIDERIHVEFVKKIVALRIINGQDIQPEDDPYTNL